MIRSTLPYLTLDEAFESKERMAAEIKAKVSASMEEYGPFLPSRLPSSFLFVLFPAPRSSCSVQLLDRQQQTFAHH
eukprot:77045-Rhodomonas_salina.1